MSRYSDQKDYLVDKIIAPSWICYKLFMILIGVVLPLKFPTSGLSISSPICVSFVHWAI